ncbi:MAG: GGDEF domain-containing protein [Candidatus Andersenbacteria bacterium]
MSVPLVANVILLATLVALLLFTYWKVRRLQEEVVRDVLTGAFNKRGYELFRDIFSRKNTPLAVISIDVNKFKQINDTHGYTVGDAVLHEIGGVLCGKVSRKDIVVRRGGDEFLILLPDTTEEQAEGVRLRLEELVEQIVIDAETESVHVTISSGCASGSLRNERDLLRRADQRMYQAKRLLS